MVYIYINIFNSNTSHPGYEVHTLFLIYMVAFHFIIMASVDTFFFYCTLYIGYQFEVCRHLVSTLGTEKDDDKKTHNLLRRVAIVHSEILM